MRIVPLLMLTLLLIGFASRPTVSAALTSGHVLLHPIEVVSVIAHTARVDAEPAHDSQATFIHCVSLGILPSTTLVLPRCAMSVTTRQTSSSAPVSRAYGILRPPQA